MKKFLLVLSILLLFSCSNKSNISTVQKELPLINFVNPFIGTGGHGHTYPGATMPFGMIQLSPDTRLEGWDGCSGYHYSDSVIYGFSHTHLSGTGVSDYGDILLMPTNTINFNNGANGKKGYRAHFSHANEIAAPGYYKVKLDTTNIEVELTVSKRSGMHKYQFPSAENQIVILDLLHRDKVLEANIHKISDTEIQGYRFSDAWATDQRLFFYIKTSHSFNDILQSPPEQGMHGGRKTALTFNNPNNDPIYIKIGISAVDEEGARKNLEKEIADKSFEDIKKEAQGIWEQQLNKIVIESSNSDYKTNFYTYPKIEASYRLVDELLIVFGGIDGGLDQNSYYNFIEENPFVSPTLFIQPTSNLYNGFAGLKGKLTNAIAYNIRASYSKENDKTLFNSNIHYRIKTKERKLKKNVLYSIFQKKNTSFAMRTKAIRARILTVIYWNNNPILCCLDY